jgi:hypothetical protein
MLARVSGCLLVAGMAALVVPMLVASPDKAGAGGPVFGVLPGRVPLRPSASGGRRSRHRRRGAVARRGRVDPVRARIHSPSRGFVAAGAAVSLWLTRAPVMASASAMSSALLITIVAWALTTYGPERFVPASVDRAADPLLESRIEAPDPYVALLAIGALLAVTVIAVVATRPAVSG